MRYNNGYNNGIYGVICLLMFIVLLLFSIPVFGTEGKSRPIQYNSMYKIRTWSGDEMGYNEMGYSDFTPYIAQAATNNPPDALNRRVRTIDGRTSQVVDREPITGDRLRAVYDYFDPDGDNEGSSEIRWYKNGNLMSGENAKDLSQTVRKGEVWHYTVRPHDGKTYGQVRESERVTVRNAPPRVTYARIQPQAPTSKTDLRAEYEYVDPDNDPEGLHEIRWYKNGVVQYSLSDQKLVPSRLLKRGDKWKYTIRPRDAEGAFGELVDSPEVTIINQKPVVKVESVTGAKDNDGDFTGDITVTYSLVDEDGDVCRLSVGFRGGASTGPLPTSASVREATEGKNVITSVYPASVLTLTWESKKDQPANKADNYTIVIKPNDGMDNGTDGESRTFSLDNNAEPVATNLVISPSSLFSGDDLTASYTFTDPDGDKESGSEIKWYKNNVEQTAYSNIMILPNAATTRGESWYFTVRPKDGKEFGELKTSSAVKINNSPPVTTEAKLEPANPTSGDDLKAIYNFKDADGDAITSIQVRWYKQTRAGMTATLQSQYNDQPSLPSIATSKDEVWYFTAQATDGITPSQLMTSNRVTIGNTIPKITGLTVPSEGFRDVNIKFDLEDADGDKCNLVVEYQGGMASTWTPATIKESLTGVSPGLVNLTWQSHKDQDIHSPAKFQLKLTPSDGISTGDTVESVFFTLDNNIPPVAANLKVLPPNPTASDNLTAYYEFSDPDGGNESGSEIVWYKDNERTINKGKILLASATAKGQYWHFTVRPRDGARSGEIYASEPVIILNSPPFVTNVIVKPAAPKAGDKLTVQYEYRDVDDDRESGTEIEWYKNGVSVLKKTIVSEEDKRMPTAVSKGEKWNVVVRPRDGEDFGSPVSSSSVTTDNASPVVKDIKVTGESGNVTITYTLIDDDGDPCDLDVQYQGGSVKTAWTPAKTQESTKKVSPGVGLKLTWLSKTDQPGQKADDYRIKITPSDVTSAGTGDVSPSFALNNNSIPTALNLAILPEKPITTDDLKLSYIFSDPDGDREGKPEIRWYKNSIQEIIYNDLTVLPSNATKKGDRWYYTIRVNDGKDYGSVQLSLAVTIGNAPPVASNIVLSPDQPRLGEPLTARYVYTDADNDLEKGTQIKWYRNGVHVTVYNNSSIVPGSATKSGDEWYFTVIPMDGSDSGIPFPSNRIYVANDPPIASSLNILPANPRATDDLIASYVYTDPNGDPESGSKVVWYKNSAAQVKYNDMLRLPSDATGKKQVWYFTVQPKDGKQFGAVKQSGIVIIENTPPRAENLSISPPYPLAKDDLVVSYDYSDVDGDTEMRSDIKWYRNDVWMSAFEGLKRIASKNLNNGEIWRLTVRPYDGTDYGELVSSPSVEIGNPIPRVNNLFITPGSPLTTDDLVAKYDYADPNNIPEAGSQITWYKNGVAQTEYGNRKILPSDATAKGEQWHFSVRPSNGRQFGAEQVSSPVTVINSPPRLKNVTPKPNNPTTDDRLAVDYIFDDPDGDKESRNEIRWFREGVLQSSYNNMTELPAGATKRGEKWYFTIRSSDGTEFSELTTSATVTIGNGRPRVENLKIFPVAPLTGDDLGVSYTFVDTEKDPEAGTEVRWFKNGVHQPNLDNVKMAPGAATERDEKWYCTVRPRDGIDFGDLFTSPAVTIGNTPPVTLDILPLSGQVLRGGSVIIVANGQDADTVDAGAALLCIISCRFGSGAWVDLSGEYVEVPAPRWQTVFKPDVKSKLGEYDFRTSFSDAAGGKSDWKVREKMVVVVNNPPVIEASADDLHVTEDTVKQFDLRLYGNDLEDGKTLTWELDADSVNKELFQAVVLGNRFLEIRPVDNKTGRSDITLKLADMDGTVSIKSDVTIIIDPVNDPPSMPTAVRIVPETPRAQDNLNCIAEGSIDPDNVTVVYRYQWYKDGVSQTGLITNTVSYSRIAKGELWRCEVTPSDGASDGPMRFAEVIIANTLPEVAIRDVTGNTKDIRISLDLKDADNDNCDVKVEYKIKSGLWKPATILESMRGMKPGLGLILTWQSQVDEVNTAADECNMRITPNDGAGPAGSRESKVFFLDNKPPVFTLTAISNPVHPHFVDVTIVTDEKLSSSPKLSAVVGEKEPVELVVEGAGDKIWMGQLILETGFDGNVVFVVEGSDQLGNTGKMELPPKEFKVPSSLPVPTEFVLGQNYPNPFSKDTKIPYQLAKSSMVVIKIYSLTGQLVKTLNEGYRVANSKDRLWLKEYWDIAYWDGTDDNGELVASGVYFYHIKAGDFEAVKKMVVKR